MSNTTQNLSMCPGWYGFWNTYNTKINYPLRFTISVVGVVTNILNLWVFCQPQMKSPINTLLGALAVSDFLCVFHNLVKFASFYLFEYFEVHFDSYQYALDFAINSRLYFLFHTWAIYITLSLSVWRHIAVAYPLRTMRLCTFKTARIFVLVPVIVGILVNALSCFGKSIIQVDPAQNVPGCRVNSSISYVSWTVKFDDDMPDDTVCYKMYTNLTWSSFTAISNSLLIKFVPCLLMSYFTIRLIMNLTAAALKRSELLEEVDQAKDARNVQSPVEIAQKQEGNVSQVPSTNNVPRMKTGSTKGTDKYDKTNQMLLMILLIFLVTEIPEGISTFLRIVASDYAFYRQCLWVVAGFLNALVYVSSATGFFVYVFMSSKFRCTFFGLIRNCCACNILRRKYSN